MSSQGTQETKMAFRSASPEFERIIAGAAMEKLAGGFGFTEGPIWMPEGYLLFSDLPCNVIRKWTPDGSTSIFREQSGCDEADRAECGYFIGSNGMALDRQNRLLVCEHGRHRLVRLEENGEWTVLASTFEGKRLNSPNDVICKSDGAIYFTDPPYGLAKQDEDPRKELSFNGVYRLAGGELQLLYTGIKRPNGLAFSPDEKVLYVANTDPERMIWLRFEVRADGSLDSPEVFYDVTDQKEDGAPDGMKVDAEGNLYCTGPGGIWVFSPDGRHLGTIAPPETPANLNWGDADRKSLYITACTGLYRTRLNVSGAKV
jgi:gluconolactonase